MASTDWIDRKPGDKRPTLSRNATVEVEHRSGHTKRTIAGCVNWSILRVNSDVIRYRLAPSEVRTVA